VAFAKDRPCIFIIHDRLVRISQLQLLHRVKQKDKALSCLVFCITKLLGCSPSDRSVPCDSPVILCFDECQSVRHIVTNFMKPFCFKIIVRGSEYDVECGSYTLSVNLTVEIMDFILTESFLNGGELVRVKSFFYRLF
jgi:hypothetical protein